MRRTISNGDFRKSAEKRPSSNLTQNFIMNSNSFSKTVERTSKCAKPEKSRKTVKQFDEVEERLFSPSKF